MNRRNFLRSAGIVSAGLAFPGTKYLFAKDGGSADWRTFDLTTDIEVLKPAGATRVWVPTTLISPTPFQRTISTTYHAEGGKAKLYKYSVDSLGIVAAEFPAGVKPVLTVKNRVETRNIAVDVSAPGRPMKENHAQLEHFLRPTATPAHRRHREANGRRNHQRQKHGCRKGARDLRMDRRQHVPRSENARLRPRRHPLHARIQGSRRKVRRSQFALRRSRPRLPAFPRATPSASASRNPSSVTRASARPPKMSRKRSTAAPRFTSRDYGWVPVDPADVRKVVLEEPPGNLPLDDDMVKKARARLFGSWEMNWVAYNFAHDVALPGSTGKPVGFLMYPQARDGQRQARQPRRRQLQIRDRREGNRARVRRLNFGERLAVR